MPNIKSAIKRVKVSRKKALRNASRKSALKTSIKKCREAIANNSTAAAEIFRMTVKDIDKAVAKKILHKNTAARKKAKLAKALNAALAAKQS